jgi:hypothetical protein
MIMFGVFEYGSTSVNWILASGNTYLAEVLGVDNRIGTA